MDQEQTDNLRVERIDALCQPQELKAQLPLKAEAAAFVGAARREIEAIIAGRDRRVLVIVGPC